MSSAYFVEAGIADLTELFEDDQQYLRDGDHYLRVYEEWEFPTALKDFLRLVPISEDAVLKWSS